MSSLLWIALLSLGALGRGEELLEELSPKPLQAESTMEALEPWETPISGFFIRSHHGVPKVEESKWVLRIDGLVEKPLTLTLADLRKMRTKTFHAVLECAGSGRGLQKPAVPGLQWKKGAVGNAQWKGVPLSELLRRAGVKSNARFGRLEGTDLPSTPAVPAFIRSVPLAKLEKEDTLIAFEMNREPLPVLHGGPIRLVLPGWYGQNWTKWLARITLTEEEDQGFFMKKGYRAPKTAVRPGEPWDSSTGDPVEEIHVQSLIVSPVSGQTVKTGDLAVRGKAFSGAGSITLVEISLDGGRSWQPAQVDSPHPSGGWQEFRAAVRADSLGPLTLLSRATDSATNRQPMDHTWNPAGYERHAVDQVTILVADRPLPQGVAVLTRKCLMCHANELIEGQRLSPKQWEGVVKKMETFGVLLESDERQALLQYLGKITPDRPDPMRPPVDYFWKTAFLADQGPLPGNAGRGSRLFAENCSSCHGDRGQGKEGPRLGGRAVSSEEFWLSVMHGRHAMPGFEGFLKREEVADVRAFLLEQLEVSR